MSSEILNRSLLCTDGYVLSSYFRTFLLTVAELHPLDINIYLHLFYQQLRNAQVGNSIYTFFQQLEGFRDRIGAVSIDACTEHARQLIVSGVDNMIIALGLVYDASGTSHSDEAKYNSNQLIDEGKSMIVDARAELKGLGIRLDYP